MYYKIRYCNQTENKRYNNIKLIISEIKKKKKKSYYYQIKNGNKNQNQPD